MHPDREDMQQFRRLLEAGSLQKSYRALLSYMLALRTHPPVGYFASSIDAI